MDRSNYTIVAALDLGFTESGYAFSLKSDFKIDPLKIQTNHVWNSQSRNFLSLKTPTCVFLNRYTDLEAFGYEAENEFADISMHRDADGFYFFSGFFAKKNFTRDAMLIDETGKTLPAIHVFKCFIEAFVDDLKYHLGRMTFDLKEDKIRWVIPVSACLTDNDKQFLRTCAEQAGIYSDQLTLVTKVEAAFIYCQQLPDQDLNQKLKNGFECMVVQLGGSVADITVLMRDANQVIEKYRVTGNDCGYSSVNNSILEFLSKILSSQVMTSLRKEDPEAFLDLEREVISITTHLRKKQSDRIIMNVPSCQLDTVCIRYFNKHLIEIISSSVYGNGITLRGDTLRIEIGIIHSVVKPTIEKIIYLIRNALLNYKDSHKVMDISMVGGFSGFVLVQGAVRKMFPDKNIIIPDEFELAVMKGAVLCGHKPCQYVNMSSSEEKSDSILTKLSQLNRYDFKDLVASGTFATYENRVYLAGPCNIGKSSLASILIGETIPKTWLSTDGLIIHFGRNGIDLQNRKMLPLRKGNGDVFTKLILGNPEVTEQQRKSSLITKKEIRNQIQDVPIKDVTQQQNKETHQPMFYEYQRKQQHQPTSTSRQIPVMRKDYAPKCYPMRFKVDQKRPIYTARSIQDNVMEAIKKRSYNVNIAPSDLVDFGGQKSFDMTHQLFIQHKGTFILMFDGRHGLHTKLTEYTQGHVTAASILEHWINSVLTYCNTSEDKMPRIVFAATHKDKFSQDQQEKLALKFQEELTTIFSSHKLHEHIMYAKVFFINATDVNDLNIDLLKDELVDIACHQSTWGQRMPIVWVPLDLLISDLREDGTKLITKEKLWEMNRSNDELALSNRRFEDFLIVQHSIGKILYFDEPALRDFIVIQPTAMVNILRAFITDSFFWPKEGPIRVNLRIYHVQELFKRQNCLLCGHNQLLKIF